MTAVGLIPARAGSKRLPGKATTDLCGRPLIAWTCGPALASGVLDAVYVNTDAREIAEIAARYGVGCPVLRPATLAADDTPTRAANRFVLEHLAARGECYDAVVVLQPTSPLRTAEDIRAAMALYAQSAPCAVESVSPVAVADTAFRVGRDGRFDPLPAGAGLWRLNGAIYIYGWDDYVHNRRPPRTLAYPMPAWRGVDIDTDEDLAHARYLFDKHAVGAPAP